MRKCEHTLTDWGRVTGVAVMYVTDSAHDEVATVTLTLAHNYDNDRHRPHVDTRTHTCSPTQTCVHTHTILSTHTHTNMLPIWGQKPALC